MLQQNDPLGLGQPEESEWSSQEDFKKVITTKRAAFNLAEDLTHSYELCRAKPAEVLAQLCVGHPSSLLSPFLCCYKKIPWE